MGILVLASVFCILLILSVPVGVAMGFASFMYLVLFSHVPWTIEVSKMTAGVNSFDLIAAPLFILTALLMNKAGITQKLFHFARALVGHFRGGLGHVNVLSSMIFAGMSGDPLADVAGLGIVQIEAMKEAGYPLDFSAALTAVSARLGPIIPPSTIMVIYASLMDQSVGRMLIAGLLPGILLGIILMIAVFIISSIEGFPRERRLPLSQILWAFLDALPPMMTPIIIIGGIAFGVFTATEAAAVAALYAFLLGYFIYRKLSLKDVYDALIETCTVSGVILFIVSVAVVFGWLVTVAQIPQLVIASISSVFHARWIVLIMLNVFFLIAGCFLNPMPIMVSLLGVLYPLSKAYHINLIHLGVFMIFNLEIGGLTPPVAISMYITATIAEVPFFEVWRRVIPFYIPLLICLFIITFCPDVVLFLPKLLFH